MSISRSSVYAFLCVAMLLTAVALCFWSYQPFKDANYHDAWWTLAALARAPLGADLLITKQVALATLLLSVAVVCLTTLLLLPRDVEDRRMRAATASLLGAVWLLSPRQLAALQLGGPALYLWMAVPLTVAVLLRHRRARTRWMCTALAVFAIALLSAMQPGSACEGGAGQGLAVFPNSLSPWSPGSFCPGTQIFSLWLMVVLSTPLLAGLRRLPQAWAPLTMAFLMYMLVASGELSERVQARSDPRLALLYALAYDERREVESWLAFEYFTMLGDNAANEWLTAASASHKRTALPISYRMALSCVVDRTAPESLAQPADEAMEGYAEENPAPELLMLRRYLEENKRC